MKYTSYPLVIGCASLALAVSLGAFGAHALEKILTERQLDTWETAVQYQFYHSLGILVLGIVQMISPNKWMARAIVVHIAGIVLFSGSLYLLSTTEMTWMGPITPIGGVAFISGWVLAIFGFQDAFKQYRAKHV